MPKVKEHFTVRTIRFQFRRTGLVHLTDVKDYCPHASGWDVTTVPHITHCGLNIPIGRGGWGHESNARECGRCFRGEKKR